MLAGGNDLGDPFDPEGIERELDTMVAALTDAGATVFTLSLPNQVLLLLFRRHELVERLVRRVPDNRDEGRGVEVERRLVCVGCPRDR